MNLRRRTDMRTRYLLALSAVAAALLLPCPAQAQCYVNYCETFAVYDPGSNAITGYASYSDYTGTYNLAVYAYLFDPDGNSYYLGGSQSEFSAEVDFSYEPTVGGTWEVMSYNDFELEEGWTFDGNSYATATVPAPAPIESPQPDIQGVSPGSPWQAGSSFYVGIWGSGFGTAPTLQIQWPDGTTYTNQNVCSGPYCDTYISDWITVPSDAGGDATVTVTSTGYGQGFLGSDPPLSNPFSVLVYGPPSARVQSADITKDNITVLLSGSMSPLGTLTVVASGPNGQKVNTINTPNNPYGPGTYTFSFYTLGAIPTGEITTITATWTVNLVNYAGTLNYHINVLGTYAQTPYNTPAESDPTCQGASTPVTIFSSSCSPKNGTPGSMTGPFVAGVNLQGSGQSINYGAVQIEAFCVKATSNSTNFRGNTTIGPALGGSLNNSTLAVCRQYNLLYVGGRRLFIQGVGVKTVTDACPGCCNTPGYAQLDNYTTSTACSGLSPLPSALTVLLY